MGERRIGSSIRGHHNTDDRQARQERVSCVQDGGRRYNGMEKIGELIQVEIWFQKWRGLPAPLSLLWFDRLCDSSVAWL